MRRPIRIILITLALLLCAAGAIFWMVSRSGSSAVEGWIASQLKEIVNLRLNPQLAFDDLDYTYPGTVSLKRMRLVAQDPAQAGKTVDILACDKATLTLAEVPQVGKPIMIERVVLDKPLFSAVALEPGSKKVVGFSNMVKQKPTTQPTTRAKLSHLLSMRLIQVNDGKIVYDPRIAGTEPMVLDQITTKLDITPTEEGWYKVATTISRKPIFELSVAGQLSLDTFTARDVALKLTADLSPGNFEYLPPQAQAQLKKYEVRGKLDLLAMGEFPVMHPLLGEMSADLTLTGANVTLGEFRIPVDKLDVSTRLAERRLSLNTIKLAALEGSAEGWGAITFNPQVDSNFELKIMGMLLQNLLASRKEGEPPTLAGKVDAEAQFTAPARVVAATIRGEVSQALSENWGSASLRLTDGCLVRVPLIRKIQDMVMAAGRMVGASSSTEPKLNERLNLALKMVGDRAEVTELTYVGQWIAARGTGSITLRKQLDLTLNAGPIEKMQNMLGEQIGGAIAIVTDKLMAYRVTGKIGDPQVEVEVGGGSVGKTIGKIGDGIGNIVNPEK